jgi:hypothetical protein
MRVWAHSEAQHWVHIDDEKTMTLLGVIEQKERQFTIAMGQYGEDEEEAVELACLVRQDHQNQGIGTAW